MILSLMIEPIKRDLGMSDTQIGLVHGFAFTILYVFVGLPMGRIADRWNRKKLAAISVALWSAMTAACGFAGNFFQLFVARMGVGVGEAGLSPAAVSLISDYFPKEKRAKPLAFLTIGTTGGAGLAMIFGGGLVEAIGSTGLVRLPVLGQIYGWQAIFLLLGLVGIAFAGIYASVREPVRQEKVDDSATSIRNVLLFIKARFAFFASHFLGAAFAVMVLIGFHSWMPTYFIRSLSWSAGEAGLAYGLIVLTAGLSGILFAGWSVETLTAKGRKDAHLIVAVCAAAAATIPMIAAPLATNIILKFSMLFVGAFCLTVPSALAPVALQIICPNQMRGQVFAVYLFVLSLLGYALGPLLIALITDYVLQDEQMLGLSLSVMALVFTPAAAICIEVGRRQYVKLIAG